MTLRGGRNAKRLNLITGFAGPETSRASLTVSTSWADIVKVILLVRAFLAEAMPY